MSIDPNDPRLTAYALGELDDEGTAEIEAFLAESAAARQSVEEIRRVSQQVTSAYAAEPAVGLSPEHRQTIEDQIAHSHGNVIMPPCSRQGFWRRYRLPTALAASLVLLVGLAYSLRDSKTATRLLAWRHISELATASTIYTANESNANSGYLAWSKNQPSVAFGGDGKLTLPDGRRVSLEEIGKTFTGARFYSLNPGANLGTATTSTTSQGGERAYLVILGPADPDNSGQSEVQFGLSAANTAFDSMDFTLNADDIAGSSGDNAYETAFRPVGTTHFEAMNVASGQRPDLMVQGGMSGDSVGDDVQRYGGGMGVVLASADSDDDGPIDGERLADNVVSLKYKDLMDTLWYAESVEDFAEYDDVSFGYKVPFGPPDAAESTAESYAPISHNPFVLVDQTPLSTFSIDVDTASYSNIRRFLNQGVMPPKDAVRIEEMINYFSYNYPDPTAEEPFSVTIDTAETPWAPDHLITRIGLKGYEVSYEDRPASNLVFLIDVSGSMDEPEKLPLVKSGIKMMIEQLDGYDRIAIVVYAGASGLALPSTSGDDQGAILAALDNLEAGGSTNGGAGIELAYSIATDNFIEGGINRVLLATDGDFNVGTTGQGELTALIEDKAKSGVFLTVLGFGMGNLNDSILETLADKGNGHYAYIDTLNEARKVLVDEMAGTLMTIAKDVKIQVEFNPATVAAYRLIGYENRVMAARDFNDDTKDAGEIGAGHTVTVLYEIVPAGIDVDLPDTDALKYQTPAKLSAAAKSEHLMTVKLRYKDPAGDVSKLIETTVTDSGLTLAEVDEDFIFATAVASFGMLLRGSPHKGQWSYEAALELAQSGLGDDTHGYRAEFLDLVQKAIAAAPR